MCSFADRVIHVCSSSNTILLCFIKHIIVFAGLEKSPFWSFTTSRHGSSRAGIHFFKPSDKSKFKWETT